MYYAGKIISKSKLRKKFRWGAGPMAKLSGGGGSSGGKGGGSPGMGNGGTSAAAADHLQTIKREIAILKKLSKHPNINALVEVLDDEKEDNLYMSMFETSVLSLGSLSVSKQYS
jgi:serine/threonine protein kinase